MDALLAYLPSTQDGYLPYYLLVISVAAIGNSLQNLLTLHFTRRIYNGRFIRDPAFKIGNRQNDDSVKKLIPASEASTKDAVAKAQDQVTPLAARLFGMYTIMAGVIRVYGAYRLDDPAWYQMCLFTHIMGLLHFTSETFVFKTIKPGWEHTFPLGLGASLGTVWMVSQYGNYVKQ